MLKQFSSFTWRPCGRNTPLMPALLSQEIAVMTLQHRQCIGKYVYLCMADVHGGGPIVYPAPGTWCTASVETMG